MRERRQQKSMEDPAYPPPGGELGHKLDDWIGFVDQCSLELSTRRAAERQRAEEESNIVRQHQLNSVLAFNERSNTGSPAQGAGSTATRSRRARDTDVTVGFDMNSDVSQAIVAIGHFARRQGGTQDDSETPSIYQRLQSIESSLGSLVGRVDRIESLLGGLVGDNREDGAGETLPDSH